MKTKANATSYKKGQPSPNPGGRPKLPDDVREARRLSQVELERAINRHLFMTPAALKVAQGDPKTTMLEQIVIGLLIKAVSLGDPYRLDLILNRLIGRVVERVEVKLPTPFVIRRGNGDEVVLGAKVEEIDDKAV